MTNKLDQIYRILRLSRYFVKGWGKPENLKRLCEFRKVISNRETCYKLVSPDYPVFIEKEQNEKYYNLIDGYFITPLIHYLPEVVPEECKKVYFQYVLPKKWLSDNFKPIVLQIAGTGDQYFWRRRMLVAKPLIKEAGIGSIILENPFYGKRKPREQLASILHNVSDIFVMGGCLMLESLVLLHFSERLGFGPLGITGLSMGGHMASIAATNWPKPLIVVPCLSGLTASRVFTQGVISQSLNWDMLEKQFHSDNVYKEEVLKMVNIIEGDAFKAGQQFAKDLSKNTCNLSTNFCDTITSSQNFEVTATKLDLNTVSLNSINNSTDKSYFKTNHDTSNLITNTGTANTVCDSINRRKSCSQFEIFCGSVADDPYSAVNSNLGGQIECEQKEQIGGKELTKTETTNRLLNLIVRLVRASVNVNILSRTTKDNLKDLKNNGTSVNEQQSLNFMNGIMDECTHLKNYTTPVDTSLAIAVNADDDAYVPLKGMSNLSKVWPGAEVRYVKGGHVRAYVQGQKEFRLAIIEAFSRYRAKYTDKTA